MRLETERLILRPLIESDRTSYVDMNADPVVMRFFPAIRTTAESNQAFDRFVAHHGELGFGFIAAELRADGRFIGIVGVSSLTPELPNALPGHPEFEIGWLLLYEFWNRGLATEGARACLIDAWERIGLDEVVAITAKRNAASRRVMEKIGMTYDPRCDYDHPMVPKDNPVCPHVLYRISKPARV
jgi:RimJ/RimL family protein N-acetyltransferase